MAKKKDPAKEEKKRRRREERKAREESARRAKRRRQALITWGSVGVVLALIGLFVWSQVKPKPEVEGVEKMSFEGDDHLAQGAGYNYEDPVPTSGPHSPNPAPCNAFTQPVPLVRAVHAMEHGTVILWHRPDVDDEVRETLEDLRDQYDSHVIVSPNPDIEDAIVATAWRRRMRFENVENPLLAEFVDTYRKRGPEDIDCDH